MTSSHSKRYVAAKVEETYVHNNMVNYGGFENRGAGREFIPQNPIVATLEEDGAEFGIGLSGMEHPLYVSLSAALVFFWLFFSFFQWFGCLRALSYNLLSSQCRAFF